MNCLVLLIFSIFFFFTAPKVFSKTKIQDPTMGKVGGESGLEKQEITSVIRKNLGSVRGCYVALPQKTPKAAGKTVMK